jgi:hypothetical protein
MSNIAPATPAFNPASFGARLITPTASPAASSNVPGGGSFNASQFGAKQITTPATSPASQPASPTAQPTSPTVTPVSQATGDASDLVNDTNAHAANIVDDLSQKPSFAGAADVLGNVGGEGGDIIGGLFKLGAQATIPTPIRQAISKSVTSLVASHTAQKLTAPVSTALDTFQAQHPNLYKSIAGIASASALAAGADEGPTLDDAATIAKQGAGVAKDMVGDAAQAVTSLPSKVVSTAADVMTPGDAADLDTITDKIAPKMNTSEMTNAVAEGRVTRASQGPVSKALFGQAPDVVEQSEGVQRAAATIQKQIPGAAQMSDTNLYKALGDNVSAKAMELRLVLESTPVEGKTIAQIKNAWATTKASQAEDVGFANMPGSKVAQGKFQNIIDEFNLTEQNPVTGKMQAVEPPTAADVWDARIAYDKSIPANVKSATSLSSESLQYQKTMWLQNRQILSDAINKSAGDLDADSQQVFKDMSDMYNARQNIISKPRSPLKPVKDYLVTEDSLVRRRY